MLRTDTGNFNRFLTSLGLLLLVAALVIPYFYFRNTDILTIPTSDLRAMSSRGRDAVLGRQSAIADLEPWVVGGASLLALSGFVLLVLGGARLKAAQESEDEETELRKDRARLEMNSLSPEERAEKVVEKAREGQQTEPGAQALTPKEATRPHDANRDTETQAGHPTVGEDLRRRREAVERIENAIDEAFQTSTVPTHRLKLQVKISSTVDAIQLDGVFKARDEGQPDVVLKTRVVFDPSFIPKTARMVADELIAQSSRYQAMTHRAAEGWLVAIVPAESEGNLKPKTLDEATKSLNAALGILGKASVVREAKLDDLPLLFATHFGHTFLL